MRGPQNEPGEKETRNEGLDIVNNQRSPVTIHLMRPEQRMARIHSRQEGGTLTWSCYPMKEGILLMPLSTISVVSDLSFGSPVIISFDVLRQNTISI